jgi:hypothetical protein
VSTASKDKKEKSPVVVLVCLYALLNAVILGGGTIAELISNRHPCTTVNNSAKNSGSFWYMHVYIQRRWSFFYF